MALNVVILFGRLTRDPEFRQTNSGVPVVRFTVACDRKFANKQTGEREADFIEVQAWRQAAEFVSRYFHKGDAITVEGSLRNNNYTDNNGVKHYGYVVMADNVGFGGSKQESSNAASGGQRYASQPADIGDLGDFEEILSDGDTPF